MSCASHYLNCYPTGSVIYLKFDKGAIVGAECGYDIEGRL